MAAGAGGLAEVHRAAQGGRAQRDHLGKLRHSNISRMRAAGIAADVVAAWRRRGNLWDRFM